MTTNYESIEKESIRALKFPNADVLQDNDAIRQRNSDLNRAQSLGNLEHSKIKIYFEDNQSKKVVETTVWAVTDNRVVLKQGLGIPINRIFKSF
jgi:Flp pilus assembly CpaE family ATPase